MIRLDYAEKRRGWRALLPRKLALADPLKPGIHRYLLTTVLMAVALWARLAIAPVSAGLQYVTFFPAVTLSAVAGGYRAGLLATVVGLVLATYIFTPPYYSFSLEVLRTSFWSNAVFLMDGIVVSLSIEAMHRYRRQFAVKLHDSALAHASLLGDTRQLRSILDNLFAYVSLLSPDGVMQEINKAPLERSGLRRDEVIGRNFCDAPWWAYDEAVRARLVAALEAARQGQTKRYDETVKMGADLIPIDFQVAPVRDGDGAVAGLLATAVEITERKRAEDELRLAAAAFDTHEAIMITDADTRIIRVNRAFERTTGYAMEEVVGKVPSILSSGHHDRAFYEAMWDSLLNEGSWSGEIWDRDKHGNIYPKLTTISAVKNERGETTQYVAIATDITERKQAEQQIHNLAFYDALTGLPNRRCLIDRIGLALSVSARNKRHGALLFLDMDNFKTINDTLGHEYGDALLLEVAQRLRLCVRGGDIVARLGGDEFVVLCESLGGDPDDASQHASQLAEKIRAVLATPYRLKEHTLHSSPSIGVCVFHGNGESVDELIKRADMAMYQAKDSGRNRVRFFDTHMQQSVETRAALESDLREAIAERQLRLYYQIQVDQRQRPIGAEALVRWVHPIRGMVPPAQFIPVAEESQLILDIGHWVMDSACRQIAAWNRNEETRGLVLAINISAQQFKQPDFVEQVEAMIAKHRIDPARLKLELTESVALDEMDFVVAKMLALRHVLGVGLSLDDFGTGYSSLSYLKRLPLHQIKIDQSFVRDITTDPSDAVMVKAIIDMAQNFGLDVIAEGVETEAQLDFLRENGCAAYQGYLFSKPVPLEAFEALLERETSGDGVSA